MWDIFQEAAKLGFSQDAALFLSWDFYENLPDFTVTPELSAALPPAWKDWSVGSREFSAGKGFSRQGTLPDGPLKIDYPGFSQLKGKAWQPVALRAAARVSEPGGRAVTANTTVIHHPTPFYLGLRQQSENESVVLEWKFFPANPKLAAALPTDKIELSIFRIEWKYVLKKRGGRSGQLSREWVREKVPCGKEIIDPASNPKRVWRKEMQSGGYEIVARCGDMRTDLNFWHWYGEGGARSANPSVISCTTDKECYLPGETAKITLHSRQAGCAVIAVGDLKLANFRSYPVKPGRNELAVALPADAMTSACYAGITLVSGEERQFGLVRFKLDQNRHRLAVALTAPETATPQEKIKVKIVLTSPDGKPQNGTVQLYAVDEGILSLTGYKVPDIFRYFYGGTCCDFIFNDIYGLLYPDLKIGPDGKIGGDGAPEAAAKELKRPNCRESAPRSAVIVLPPTAVNGSGEFEIALPDHLGALRLMAVASAPERVGSADRVMKMRDKIGLLTTAPQVCAPGDETEVTFTLFNHDQPAGKMELTLDLPGQPPKVLTVGTGKSVSVPVRIKLPAREGLFTFNAIVKKDQLVKKTAVKIPVRLANPATVHTVLHTLKPGEKWTSDKKGIPAFASDAKYSLTLSGSCAATLKDAVGWLNEYPYGCLEQTVSGAFPFLAADALEKCGVLTSGEAATAKVKLNLSGAKILSMMLYNGAFPMWQSGTEEWSAGTVYAAHFLTAGNLLRDYQQKKLLAGYLKSRMQNASVPRYERAYAAYVLALMQESRQETAAGARNLLKTPQDDFAAFLATAALLESGFSGEAWPHLNRLLSKEIWRTDDTTPHFVRPSARAGMTLYILMKLRTDAPETIAKLRQTLLNEIKPDGSGWGVTHDNAWAVLGLAELERAAGAEKSAGVVTLPDGVKRQVEPGKNPSFTLKNANPVTVENTGNTPIYVQYRVRGVPVKAEPVRGALRLRREILRGNKAVDSARQGDLLTVRIQLESTGAIQDVVLSDLLPGGLEIEDERFATRARSTGTRPDSQLKNLIVKQVEKRPGEFVLSGDLHRGTAEITYQVRAVSRGKFTMGSTAAEAMYDPATRAFEPAAGSFEVK